MKMDLSVNVFGGELEPCGKGPLSGFCRDVTCNTCDEDTGSHTVCIETTTAFLEYSRFRGNDLSSPVPEYGFKGLRAGDRWCLCAARWLEAYESNMAPRIYLARTHIKALELIPLAVLRKYALDLN